MIIKKINTPFWVLKVLSKLLFLFFKFRFNRVVIRPIQLKPSHSYIIMMNHCGFADGFVAYYLIFKYMFPYVKDINIMSVKKQLKKNSWLRFFGSFSIDPGRASVDESINHAAQLLNKPGSLLLLFPQGDLESLYVGNIEFKEGVNEIVPRIKGDCQLIWCTNTIEFFEALRSSIFMNLFDCGTNHDFRFEELKQKVNQYHKEAQKRNLRYTDE